MSLVESFSVIPANWRCDDDERQTQN